MGAGRSIVPRAATCLLAAATTTTGQPTCIPHWSGGLGAGALTDYVYVIAEHDPDGPGPNHSEVYAGGAFNPSTGCGLRRIGRLVGNSWLPVGTGTSGPVRALASFDGGQGGAGAAGLYAAGEFTQAGSVAAGLVARWNGNDWFPVGAGLLGQIVDCAAVFDEDGPGGLPSSLFVGGQFSTAGGVAASRIARWNGIAWSKVGPGLNDQPTCMAVHDDGSGAALYVGGLFNGAGGLPANRIARWDGAAWSAVGGGVTGPTGWVNALISFDEDGPGSGPAMLYAGGTFSGLGGVSTPYLARWTGAAWQPVGGPGLSVSIGSAVNALAAFDPDGPGQLPPSLHIGGQFTSITVAGQWMSAWKVARWTGSGFEALGSGLSDNVAALCSHRPSPSAPPQLIVGGAFPQAGGLQVGSIARWDGSSWSGFGGGFDGPVRAFAVWDEDSTGPVPPRTYAGGSFVKADGATVNRVGVRSGDQWTDVGGGANDAVRAMVVHDDGSGERLYAGGSMTALGGVPVGRLGRWDGDSWAPVAANAGGRSMHSLAYTGAFNTNRVFLFGGRRCDGPGCVDGQTWRWTGTRWTLEPGAGPSAREGAAMADDPAHNRLVLFGGRDDDGVFGDTWVWNGAAWSLASRSGPPARHGHALAFDQARSKIVLFGGRDASGKPLNDTWLWDGTSWALQLTGRSPQARARAAMAFDRPSQKTLLFGGEDGVGPPRNDTWLFDGEEWEQVGTVQEPSARSGHAMSSSYQQNKVVLFGGADASGSPLGDTWDWDGAQWALRAQTGPSPRADHAMTYNDATQRHMLYGGGGLLSDTWFWDGAAWSMHAGGFDRTVRALEVFDEDGPGPVLSHLFAGGEFTAVDGVVVQHAARWDGSAWSVAGTGLTLPVRALRSLDTDGAGPLPPSLFAASGVPGPGFSLHAVCRLDAGVWTLVGGAMDGPVSALGVFDEDGEGPAPPKLFAGGFFSSAGGTACANIARLDAGGWTALAAGIGGTVDALAIFDPDGAGPRTPALHAGGDFTSAGGLTTSGIAYWDGLVWHAQESGTDGDVLAIAPFDSDGPSGLDPPVLYVGGDFQLAGGASASRAALWTGCAPESLCYADCTADLLLSIADFGCFQTRFVSGELYADCNADGLLTVADFGCFQTRFLAGCP